MKAATHSGAFYHIVGCFLQHIRLIRRFKLRTTISALFFICVLSSVILIFPTQVFAAINPTLEPSFGHTGTVITIKCTGLAHSVSGWVWFDIDANGVMDAGEPSVSVTTTSLGTLPGGTTLIAPAVAAGVYPIRIDAPSGNPIEASPDFTVLPATILLTPSSGPYGTIITISGGGFAASAAGNVWFDSNGNGEQDTDEPSSSVTTNSTGAIPSGVSITAPAVVEGIYQVQADIPTGSPVETSASFTITPAAISLNPSSGVSGTVITVTGGGFTASTTGYIWFDTDDDSAMDSDEPQVPVTSTVNGAIPAGTTLTAPVLNPIATYRVRADIPSSDSVEASADFNTPATTTWLTVTKYDAYGNVLATESITYQWLEANLPIQGNGTRRYYHQGPSFDNSTLEKLWDPGETDNVETRNYGLPMGTDVKDICAMVGEANPGDTIQIKASDNFNKWFDYEDIYNPEPVQGKLVICWYNADFGGYVPAYSTGMRLVFFAETIVSGGRYAFGNWDMHETLPASRWYFFVNSDGDWPSSSGLSVQYIANINIYEPNLISCDASGNPKDSFGAGETVYVKGRGLSANNNYQIWIQDEPVLSSPLDSLDRPSDDPFLLNAGNDPSGAQETIITNASGDFGPTAIWDISPSAGDHEYDIVADNQASGTIGTYDIADAIDNPGWQGFAVTAISEFISFTITDYNGDGIKFGHLVQGDTDQPADWSGSQGAVTITIGSETNVDVDIQVKSTDFSGTVGTIPISNVKYDDDDNPDDAKTLTGTYATWYTVDLPLSVDHVTQVYYWITIPADANNGDYASTFYYKAVNATP